MKRLLCFWIAVASSLGWSDSSSHQIGLGASTPWLVSGMYEYWPRETPVVVRAHAGTLLVAYGGGAGVGYAFDNEGDFRQFVGLAGEASVTALLFGSLAYGCGGLKYGMRYQGFYADIGAAVGGGGGDYLIFESELGNFFPMAHIGYSWEI